MAIANRGGSTEWLVLRKLVQTSLAAKPQSLWVSMNGEAHAHGPPRPIRGGLELACGDGPITISGADRAYTFKVHRGAAGVWAEASVRFRPVLEGKKAGSDGLPDQCWAPVS